MNVIEIIDPITGKKKKRTWQTPTQSDIQKNIQKIAPNPTKNQTLAYDARPKQMGTPRVQGYNGVNQGAMGWLANLTRGNMDKVNSIISSITQPKKYEMPEFKTNDALSKDWFNTALQRIQVRNQMKMDMARQKALADIIAPLLNAQSSDRRAGVSYLNNLLTNATQRRGQDLRNKYQMGSLEEQKRWHNIMNKYYQGLLKAKEQKTDNPKGITSYQEEMLKQKRLNMFLKNPTTIIPYYDKLSDEDKIKVRDYFVNSGKIPYISYQEGGFGEEDKYNIVYPDEDSNMQTDINTAKPLYEGKMVKRFKTTDSGEMWIELD